MRKSDHFDLIYAYRAIRMSCSKINGNNIENVRNTIINASCWPLYTQALWKFHVPWMRVFWGYKNILSARKMSIYIVNFRWVLRKLCESEVKYIILLLTKNNLVWYLRRRTGISWSFFLSLRSLILEPEQDLYR